MSSKPSTDPIEAQAKADMLYWATNPKTERERRTFAKIGTDGVYPIAALIEGTDFIQQLFDCQIELIELTDKKPILKKPPPDDIQGLIAYYKYQQRKRFFKFTPNPEVTMKEIHQFIDDLLELSVSSGNHPRATMILDTIKNMNRPAMNPLAALSGLMTSEEPELIEEVPANE